MSNIFFGLTDKEYEESKRKKNLCIEKDDSDSSDSFIDTFKDLTGGGDKNEIPNGGFPPLTICNDKTISDKIGLNKKELTNKDKKKRGFASDTKLTVHKILDDSDITPIFNIPN
jgi:hypothetical protein